MEGIYGRITKITAKSGGAGGRSRYISNAEKQEEIVLHEVQMEHEWKFYSQYEAQHSQEGQANNEALEIVVQLPNDLYKGKEGDTTELKTICDEIIKEILQGRSNDYEYAVHWNHNRTNLHMHFLFSEREPVMEREEKRYARDIWQDKTTHKLAKAGADNAELVHKRGEVMKDKDGNVRYNDEPLTPKNIRFKQHSFPEEKNKAIHKVLEAHGYDIRLQTKDSPYLSQKKLYKGASEDYLESAKAYNEAVKDYNGSVEQHIKLEPEIRPTYCEIRHDIEDEVRLANRRERKISTEAIEAVKGMSAFVKEQVMKLKASVIGLAAELTIGKWWKKNKDELVEKVNKRDEKREEVKQANDGINRAAVQIGKDKSLINAEEERIKREEAEKLRIKQSIKRSKGIGHGGIDR